MKLNARTQTFIIAMKCGKNKGKIITNDNRKSFHSNTKLILLRFEYKKHTKQQAAGDNNLKLLPFVYLGSERTTQEIFSFINHVWNVSSLSITSPSELLLLLLQNTLRTMFVGRDEGKKSVSQDITSSSE